MSTRQEQNKGLVLAQLNASYAVHRILAEDDLVVTHATVLGGDGTREVAFDLWQVTDGRVARRRGDREPWAAVTANGHTQVDGVRDIDTTVEAAATKDRTETIVRTILIDKDLSDLDAFLAGEDYQQHNPRFADGISGLAGALAALAEQGITMTYDALVESVADGDFGYTYSTGTFGGTPYVFHDLFRIADGRAVEHWDVMTGADTETEA